MSLHVICYDLPDSRRRARCANLLEGFGRRVQKSVYECDLSATQARQLESRLAALLAPDDKLNIYPLCGKDQDAVLAWDRLGSLPPESLWVV
jgi:CRISPR-associated protein Cas2